MINTFITRENLGHRCVQLIILLAHLLLLSWILYTLSEGGILPFKSLLFHFLGISVYGAILIRTCAWYYKRQYEKELRKHGQRDQLDA